MERIIIHVDLDAFFVSVEQALDPSLQGKPVIVGGQPDRRGVVAAASYEARAYGIHSAMPLAQAHRLCPHAVFLHGNFARYREVSGRFMAVLGDFTPDLEPAGMDEAYLDITGCDMFGPPRKLAETLKERVKKECRVVASVGIASSKIVAKIASDYGKPDGLVEVPRGKEKEFLSPLDIARMPGVGKRTEQKLRSIGITTIGKLADMPPETAKNYLGKYGLVLHQHACGIDSSKVEAPGEAKSISREMTFSQDIRENSRLKAVLGYLRERVGAELRRQNKQARTVSLKIRFDDFETLNRSRSTGQSFNTDKVIFEISAALLERVLAGNNRPVRLLGVEVSSLSFEGRQLTFFDAGQAQQEKLDKAIDRIRKKYGFRSVQKGRTLSSDDIFERGGI